MNTRRLSSTLGRLALLAVLLSTAACGGSSPPDTFTGGTFRQKPFKPYTVNGRMYVPQDDPNYDAVGIASWYGGTGRLDDGFHGKRTAWGDVFDRTRMTAAHKTLPRPTTSPPDRNRSRSGPARSSPACRCRSFSTTCRR